MSQQTRQPTTAREAILQRIRVALGDAAAERVSEPHLPRAYRQVRDMPRAEIIARFNERVGEYKAGVRETTSAELPRTIATALSRRGVRRLVVPIGFPDDWLPSGIELIRDDPPLSNDVLDSSDGVPTTCALGIAQTGTPVLDAGPGQGRRALVPDYHLCVVRVEQVVDLVPEAIAALLVQSRSSQPITFISGPAATSDIELSRVEGVHGPRTLEVLVVRVFGDSDVGPY
jgi:L-lactate dehydrogenase complex protein LldG